MITESTSIERIGAAAMILSKYQILNYSHDRSFDSTAQEEQALSKIFGGSFVERAATEWDEEVLQAVTNLSLEAIRANGGGAASNESIPIEERKLLYLGQVVAYIFGWIVRRGGDKLAVLRLIAEADD